MPDANTYWDRHVSASNLPGDDALTAQDWPREIAFYVTPEQDFAYRALEPIESSRILEIGCGVGVNAIYLAHRGARVVGMDASLPRLTTMRDVAAQLRLAGNVDAVCARAEQLPFRAESLDAAYSKATLIHTDLPVALAECRRVLRPAGRGVFCEPTTSNPFAWIYRRFFAPREWQAITHYFSRDEERIVNDTFGNLRRESFYLLSFLAFYWQFHRKRLKRFKRWLRVLHGLDTVLFTLCPPLRRLAWFRVYVVEK